MPVKKAASSSRKPSSSKPGGKDVSKTPPADPAWDQVCGLSWHLNTDLAAPAYHGTILQVWRLPQCRQSSPASGPQTSVFCQVRQQALHLMSIPTAGAAKIAGCSVSVICTCCSDASNGAAWGALRSRILRACTELSVSGCSGVNDAFIRELFSLTLPVHRHCVLSAT